MMTRSQPFRSIALACGAPGPARRASVSVLTSSTNSRDVGSLPAGPLLKNSKASTSLIATGLYSMPCWIRYSEAGGVPGMRGGGAPGAVVARRSFAASVAVGCVTTRSRFSNRVSVESGSRKSMTLTRYWLSCRNSSAESTAAGGRTALQSWYVSRIHF
jgi:hypothetical protein